MSYTKKKVIFQNGGSRFYYYKIDSNGKKKRISEEAYQRGGENLNTDYIKKVINAQKIQENELKYNTNNFNKRQLIRFIEIPIFEGEATINEKDGWFLSKKKEYKIKIFITVNKEFEVKEKKDSLLGLPRIVAILTDENNNEKKIVLDKYIPSKQEILIWNITDQKQDYIFIKNQNQNELMLQLIKYKSRIITLLRKP